MIFFNEFEESWIIDNVINRGSTPMLIDGIEIKFPCIDHEWPVILSRYVVRIIVSDIFLDRRFITLPELF